MIISKTPYRISFFGGGSDYPAWYLRNGGTVISSTINKYIYISCRELPPYFSHKHRIVYSIVEEVKKVEEIKHRVVKYAIKNILKKKNSNLGLEIHYDGDFPSRTGMGSSSSFVVGLLNVLNNFFNKDVSKKYLADQSINLEQNILKEVVGSQDQIASSFGGFNEITFNKNGKYEIKPLLSQKKELEKLEENLILVFAGTRSNSGTANDIAKTFVNKLSTDKRKNILEIIKHAKVAKKLLKSKKFDDFGLLLNETWKLKKDLSSSVSNYRIDNIYDLGIKSGALGGKLLGAGGSGFFLFYVPSSKKNFFIKKFKDFIRVPFKFEKNGTKIIFNDKLN